MHGSGGRCDPRVSLRPALFGKALVERTKIDHDPLVGSVADLLHAVACRHLEVDTSSLDVDDLGRRAHVVAKRRGGDVLYIYCRADRAFTCVQIRPDGIERGIFHDENHHRRRKHLRQKGVLESIGEMFGLHAQRRCSSGSQRNLSHSVVPDHSAALGMASCCPCPAKRRSASAILMRPSTPVITTSTMVKDEWK